MSALQDFKQNEPKYYEKLMQAINEGLDQYRKLFPNDNVAMEEENDSMFVTLNGKRISEIEFDHLIKGKGGTA